MHCVKRIKCCGWTDEVTFLDHPDSLFPLNSMMMMMMMLMALHGAEMGHWEIKLNVRGQPNVPHTQDSFGKKWRSEASGIRSK